LVAPHVDDSAHVNDIVALIDYEDLHDVTVSRTQLRRVGSPPLLPNFLGCGGTQYFRNSQCIVII